MANLNCLVKPGLYNIASSSPYAEIGAQYRFVPSGTGWAMSIPNGASPEEPQIYLLKNGNADGKAISEIAMGAPHAVSLGDPVLVETQDGFKYTQRNHQSFGSDPMIEYIYDASNDLLFRVIAVLDDNTIQLEGSHGVADGSGVTLSYAYYCKGAKLISIDLNLESGNQFRALTCKTNAPVVYTGPLNLNIQVNVNDGPFLVNGNGSVMIHQDASLQRLS